MWSYEREQARLQEMLEILNDEEGQGVAYDEYSDIDQSDDDEVDHVEEQPDNSDSEQDISDDGEMVEESHSNRLSFIGKDKVTRWRKLASQSITTKTRQMNIVKRLPVEDYRGQFLLDSASSQSSFITGELCNKLGLKKQTVNIAIKGVGES
ncbi:hypothetical protein JTB14_011298 [Gonioctena quinquepunctata]|nr:hypothetical protein JTB14_011298 [Gonioctena quinquepunctata]